MKKVTVYVFLMSLMLVLWNTYIIRPVKIMAAFVHEIGHFIMALVFDSKVAVFSITLDESSRSVSSGGIAAFFIANGGYIMSLVFAVFVLRVVKPNMRRYVLGGLSSVALLSLIYVPKVPASFLYVIIFSVITIIIYMIDNDKIFDYSVDIIGVSSIVYCIYETLVRDIVSRFDVLKDVIACSNITTDSEVLYKITGVLPIVWGSFWFLVSLGVMVFCIRMKKKRKY